MGIPVSQFFGWEGHDSGDWHNTNSPAFRSSEVGIWVFTNCEPLSHASHTSQVRQILVPSPVVLKNSFIIPFCPSIKNDIVFRPRFNVRTET